LFFNLLFLNMKCFPDSLFPSVHRYPVSLFRSTCSQHLAPSHSYILSLAYYYLSRSIMNREDNNINRSTVTVFTPQSARIDRF
jgi:hypothetical protein